ncbi:cytochrome P450, partial [Sparassis latifolia]
TTSSLLTFILAMALFPEVERKAQEEIDIAVGGDRLPQFTDRDALPYVECVLQETMRWHGAFPIGVPHRSLEDDVYNGMLILKGSIVFADPLAMSRDESVYKDAWTYYPDRVRHSIGTGRAHTMSRICPGRYLADASVRIAIASILATLSITRELREDGREIIAEAISAPSITSHPKPYPCVIKPRSVK